MDDGRMYYVRYRSGYFSLCTSLNPTSDVGDAVGGNIVYEETIGDGFDGYLTTGEMMELTDEFLDWAALSTKERLQRTIE